MIIIHEEMKKRRNISSNLCIRITCNYGIWNGFSKKVITITIIVKKTENCVLCTRLLVHSLLHCVYISLGVAKMITSCVDFEKETISYTKYIYVFDSEMRWHWHTWSLLLQKPPAAVTKEAMIIVIIPFSLLDVSKKWVLSFEETVYTSQQHTTHHAMLLPSSSPSHIFRH